MRKGKQKAKCVKRATLAYKRELARANCIGLKPRPFKACQRKARRIRK
jgi:hypothetical protein